MRVLAAARRFDRTPFLDAYSGDPAFLGQLGLYDDGKRDSESSERRVISTGPDSVPPVRGVIEFQGTRYILGHGNPDHYRGEIVRVGYVAHEAPYLAKIQTLGQLCRDEVGISAWSAHSWVKNSGDGGQSSKLEPSENLYFSRSELVGRGTVVTLGADRYIVRVSRHGPAGMVVALADRLEEPSVEVVDVVTGTWNPITETMTGATLPVRVLRTRWQSLYEYRSSAGPKFTSGDIQVIVDKSSLSPKPGQKLSMSDGIWQVEAVADEGDVWICKAVRHA